VSGYADARQRDNAEKPQGFSVPAHAYQSRGFQSLSRFLFISPPWGCSYMAIDEI
jgi:hypothetical protein